MAHYGGFPDRQAEIFLLQADDLLVGLSMPEIRPTCRRQ
jgi:hypothetical protein